MNSQPETISHKTIAAIVATGLMSFCGVIVETSMNIAFPKLMHQFGVTTNIVQWMTSIYLLIVAIIVPLSAILKAKFKTKTLFITAISLFICGVVIDSIAPSFWVLLLGRSIQGIGTGISLPLMFNIIMEQIPKSKLGMMMGFGNIITGIAPAIGPNLGGIITTSLGWRWIFIILLPFLLISLFLGIWGIQQKSPLRQVSLDFISCVLIAITFSGMVYGFSNLSAVSFMSLQVGGTILMGLIAMVLLIIRSLHLETPILDFRLFTNHRFAGHVLIFFLTQMCSLGFAFLLPNYIQLVNGNTALNAGLVVMPAGIGGAIFAPIGGRLLDKFGPRKPVMTGAGLMTLSIIIFTTIALRMSNQSIMFVYIFYMVGMGCMMGTIMTSALASLPHHQQTQGNAFLNTLQQFAGSLGTSLTAMIVALSQRGGSGANATAIGTQHAFIMLFIFVAMILITIWREVPKSLKQK